MWRLASLLFVLLAGLGCSSYTGGELAAAPSTIRTLPCIDIAVTLAPEPTTVVYNFGNRCDVDVRLDLTRAAVVARTASGAEIALGSAEPATRAFRATTIDARTEGRERIRYASTVPTQEPFTAICVDLSGVTTAATAPPLCFAVVPVAVPPPTPDLRFGTDWSTPSKLNPSVDVYADYESIQTRNLKLSESSIGSFPASALGPRISAVTVGAHSTIHILPSLYFGIDMALGGGSIPVRSLRAEPAVTTQGAAFHAHMGGIIGTVSPRLGPVDVRGEVLLGGRLFLLDVEERYGCTHDGCAGLFGGAFMVQPKGILEAWLSPRVTVGAFGGADVLHPGDWTAGILFSVHAHAHDASR